MLRAILFCLSAAAALAAERRPNILFLLADDQRADTIAALGNPELRTPAIDTLVARGTTFTRVYCMGSAHGAVCIPSRAMLMSGRSLFRVDDHLRQQETWPEKFRGAGYRTFITGKWHNGMEALLRSFAAGQAIYPDGMGDPYKLPLHDIVDGRLGPARVSAQHAAAAFADAAVEFLRDQRLAADPFLCLVSFTLPHDPRVAPPEYHARFVQRPPPLPENFAPQHPFNNGALTIRDEALAAWPRSPDAVRAHLADYYACIEYVDAQVDRILRALAESGQEENTLVVYSADHGLAIGSHGLMGKQNLYEHSMRAPLIIAGPGVPRGQQRAAFAYLYDIFPTLGELTRVPAPAGNEGRSLVAAFGGAVAGGRDAIFTSYSSWQRAIRDDRWKLVVYPKINRVQLFDLAADPAERRDLASDPAFAPERARLTQLLRQQQAGAGDTLPLHTDQPLPAEFQFPKNAGPPATREGG